MLRHINAIDFEGTEDVDSAYTTISGFDLLDPSPSTLTIPLDHVFMQALYLRGYENEPPEVVQFLRESSLELNLAHLRTKILSLCIEEDAKHRLDPAADQVKFLQQRQLEGLNGAEALQAWRLHVEQDQADKEEAARVSAERGQEPAGARPQRIKRNRGGGSRTAGA